MRPRIFAIVALLLLPLLSHLPELLLPHDCNPMAGFTGLRLAPPPVPILPGQCFIDGNAGLTLQALGHLAAEDWLSFSLPWWDPYAGLGMPLAAEMQPAAFFLPFILLLHFPAGLLLIKIAMQLLAGFCMLDCLRIFGLGWRAALMGALLYQLNGTFAWYGDAPMLPLPFLPLLVAGIERARIGAAASVVAGVPRIALGIGFSLLAGFPETAFMNGLLAALFALLALLTLRGAERLRFCAGVLGGGLAGLAAAAPALMPFLASIAAGAETFRLDLRSDLLMHGQVAALLIPTLLGLPNSDVVPNGWGSAGGYVGTGTALLGVAALIGVPGRHRLRGLALGWTAFWLAVFLGEPVTRAVWQSIPVLNLTVVTRYAMPSISFLWTVLAALAWQAGVPRGRLAAGTVAVLAAGAACLVTHRVEAAAAAATLAWTAILVGVFALGEEREASNSFLKKRRPSLAFLILTDAFISFTLPQLGGTGGGSIDTAPIAFLAAQPGFLRSYALGSLLEPNYGSYFAIPTLQAFFIPAPRLWTQFAPGLDRRVMGEMFAPSTLDEQARQLISNRAAFAAAGVGFILSRAGADPLETLADPHFRKVFRSATTRIYRLSDVKPYFDVVSGGPCTVLAHSRVLATATCASPATVLRRELFDPGWQVRVDGRKGAIIAAGLPFQSVPVSAGRTDLAFAYAPPHARLIGMMVVAGLGALAACFTRRRGA